MSTLEGEIRKHVAEALIEVIKLKDPGVVVPPLTDDICPIGNLGLDSAGGVHFTSLMSDRVGFEFPDALNLLVVDEPRKRPRTFGEIVDVATKALQQKK